MTINPTVRVAFIDVGQGDTIVVSIPETREAVIIDCLDPEAVISYLEEYDIRYIRGLIVTHLHYDHYKGIMRLINNIKSILNLNCESLFFYLPKVTQKIWERIQSDEDGHSHNSVGEANRKRQFKDILTELLRWASLNRDKFNSLAKQPGVSLPLPGIIELIHPWEVDIHRLIGNSLNNISGVLKVKGNGTSAILTGDLEPAGWDCLKNNEAEMASDVLKFPHHGAWKDRDPEDLTNTISPSLIVISVGTDGQKYNHPNPHVLKSLSNCSAIRVLCTQATSQCMGKSNLRNNKLNRRFEKYHTDTGAFLSNKRVAHVLGPLLLSLGIQLKLFNQVLIFIKTK